MPESGHDGSLRAIYHLHSPYLARSVPIFHIFRGKGTNIQEGPGVNVARIQKNGRNFEYASGEDPAIGVALLPNIVDGIQLNVMAIVKHYIGNTQETDRTTVNELVDEKLLMELYGPPFRAAVQRAAGVMCAYNLVNGVYACENPMTLETMLKGRYNFSGEMVNVLSQ